MVDRQAADPATRGRLVIDDRVVERIATLAAQEITGVTRSGSALDRVVGRRYPKADARTAGGHTRVSIQLAVLWPAPLATVARQVRDRVHARLRSLTGLTVDAVDVTAAKIVRAGTDQDRKVE